jgi:hypothetical protein
VRYLSIATFACIFSFPAFVLAGENHHSSKDLSFERLRAEVLEHAAARQQQFLARKNTDTTLPDSSIVDSELEPLTIRNASAKLRLSLESKNLTSYIGQFVCTNLSGKGFRACLNLVVVAELPRKMLRQFGEIPT